MKNWHFGLVVLLGLICWPAPAAETTDITGQILLERRGRPARNAGGTVVVFTPKQPVQFEVQEEPFEVVTVRKEFQPRALAVPVGSTVRFPNQDTIIHNVFSASGKNRFDLGLYRRGEGKDVTFTHPGTVRVFCNVHHSMVAYVLVVETPFTTLPSSDGQFRLRDLPVGEGTLMVWNERSEPWSQEITLPLSKPLEIPIEITKPRIPQHKNKYGKPYERRRSGKSYR